MLVASFDLSGTAFSCSLRLGASTADDIELILSSTAGNSYTPGGEWHHTHTPQTHNGTYTFTQPAATTTTHYFSCSLLRLPRLLRLQQDGFSLNIGLGICQHCLAFRIIVVTSALTSSSLAVRLINPVYRIWLTCGGRLACWLRCVGQFG